LLQSNCDFSIFQDGGCRHLGLDFINFQILLIAGSRNPDASSCQILSKFVNPLQSNCDFSIFHDGGRLPSWICLGQIWTTPEGYFVVFITVENLVAIDAVVSII